MIFYFTSALSDKKTIRDFLYSSVYACICICTYFTIVSIYWSDTSLDSLCAYL